MPNTPTYILYHGRNTGKDKQGRKIWTRFGAVWPNTSGTGFHLTGDDLPLGDGLTVTLPFDKEGGEFAPPEVEQSCLSQSRLCRQGFSLWDICRIQEMVRRHHP